MTKLGYKSRKWDKEMANLCKYKEILGEGYNRQIDTIILNSEKNSDYFWMCASLTEAYETLAQLYLTENNNEKVVENIYLSIASFFTLYRMNRIVVPTQYVHAGNVLSKIEYAICKAITIGCYDEFLDCYDNTIMGKLFSGNLKDAKKLIEKLPDLDSKAIDVYYIKPQFLKSIYYALIDKDEHLFVDELSKRIKKYRSNMVGYSTIIDYSTIALIKTAKLYGINVHFDIAEVPLFLMEQINKEFVTPLKIPFQDNIEKMYKLI